MNKVSQSCLFAAHSQEGWGRDAHADMLVHDQGPWGREQRPVLCWEQGAFPGSRGTLTQVVLQLAFEDK